MSDTRYNVTVQAEDGHHMLEEDLTYEDAKIVADDWLGDICEWTSKYRAISMYGGVLEIEQIVDDEEWEHENRMQNMMMYGADGDW